MLASLNTLGSNFVVVRDNWLTCDRPEARDLFISDPVNREMTDAFQTLMMNISINWPWQISELITLRTDVDSLLLNPTFEQYVKDINNWSLNPAALVAFPALINKVWVNPDPDEEEHFPYEVASQVEDAAFAFQ